MTNSKQHPLSSVLPGRTDEELVSIAECEGVVVLEPHELAALTACEWFRCKNASQRALMVSCLYDRAARGSNQHKRRPDPRSPMAAARTAVALLKKVSHA